MKKYLMLLVDDAIGDAFEERIEGDFELTDSASIMKRFKGIKGTEFIDYTLLHYEVIGNSAVIVIKGTTNKFGDFLTVGIVNPV